MMKVMRMANQRGKSKLDLYSLLQNTGENHDTLKYPLQNLTYWNKGQSTTLDTRTMIPICFFEKFNENGYLKTSFSQDSCVYFQPVFTDLGTCHSFNSKSVLDSIKPSYFIKSFAEAFEYDIEQEDQLHYGTKSGYSFNFYLMGNHRIRKTTHGKTSWGNELGPLKFFLGISNANDFFNLKTSSKIVPAGYKITYNVQAMEISPTENLKDIPIESRNCRLPQESDGLEIFKRYSKSACEFEFRLKKAKEACECTPWYIPSPSKERYTICDVYGNYCFRTIWNQYQSNIKECLPGCHQLEFISSEIREKLDAEYICTKGNKYAGMRHMANKVFQYNGYGLFHKVHTLKRWNAAKNFNNETYNSTQAEIEFCKELVENDLAEVSVMFERPKFIRTIMSKRVSFADQLGVFGNLKVFCLKYLNTTNKNNLFKVEPLVCLQALAS